MGSQSADTQLEGATFVQRLLSKENDPPIDAVAAVPGLIPKVVSLLDRDDAPKLQFECCWVLTNVRTWPSNFLSNILCASIAYESSTKYNML